MYNMHKVIIKQVKITGLKRELPISQFVIIFL